MKEFTYAHKDTESYKTCTAQFNSPVFGEIIEQMRRSAAEREIPVSDGETLAFLQTVALANCPQNILELGTATGVSGAVLLGALPNARLTTVERDENFFNEAKANFKKLGLAERVNLILGDAGEVICGLEENSFDFIFLDCAKVQYIKYLPRLKKLLKSGGVLVADDVLLFGYVSGENEIPKKRRMLVEHVKEYVDAVTHDSELSTTVINLGNGIALSVKK